MSSYKTNQNLYGSVYDFYVTTLSLNIFSWPRIFFHVSFFLLLGCMSPLQNLYSSENKYIVMTLCYHFQVKHFYPWPQII